MSLSEQLAADIAASGPAKPQRLSDQLAADIAAKKPSGSVAGTIGATTLGALKGAFDTVIDGPAQFLANAAADAYPDSWPGKSFLNSQKDIANKGVDDRAAAFKIATANHETAANVGQMGGSIAAGLALPVAKGATLLQRAAQAAKAGAVIGAAQPVENASGDSGFYVPKAVQAGVGAVGGFVGQPVTEGLGAVAAGAFNKTAPTVRRMLNVQPSMPANIPPDLATAASKASPALQAEVSTALQAGKPIDPSALARQVEADSLPVPISLMPGQATQDPILISTERNLRSKNPDTVYRINDQAKQLVQNFDALRDKVAPDIQAGNNQEAASHIINSLQTLDEGMKSKTSALYKALEDANGGSLPMDGVTFASQANQALDKSMKGAFLPPQLQGILNKFQSGERPMTFENFENLRSILSATQRTAERSGDGNAGAAASIMHDALLNTPISSEAASVKALADAARASAKSRFDLMNQSPAFKAVASGDAVPDNFVRDYITGSSKNASADKVQHLISLVGQDPAGLQAIKAAGINHLAESSGANGNGVSQAALNKAIRTLQPKMGHIFGSEDAHLIQTLGNVAGYIQKQPAGSYVNNSNTDVANLARTGGNLLAGAVDAHAGGLPVGSVVNNAINSVVEGRAGARRLNDILKPGAGIAGQSPSDALLKNRIPNAVGKTMGIPLSKLLSEPTSDEFTK